MALKLGSLRAEQKVLHRCDDSKCWADEHLFIGTQLDNMRDKVAKGRQPQGVDINFGKLTKQEVWEIRRFAQAGFTQQVLAEAYGCTQSNVSCIVNFKTRRLA